MRIFKIIILCVVVCCITFSQNTGFRFAWLSDPHVGSSTGADDLSMVIKEINSIDDIKFTVISGDISETGKTKDLILSKKILDSLKKPYYIIPGNHDTKWSESGATKFSDIFESDKFEFDFQDLKFIGLHQGPIMKMGDGHFSQEDLRWFRQVLSKLKSKNQPLVIITHYPIDESIDNWFEFIDIISDYNIKMILVGHGHANQNLRFENFNGVMGRSTLRSKTRKGGYNLVSIQDNKALFNEKIIGEEIKPVWDSLDFKKRLENIKKKKRPNFEVNKNYPNVIQKWIFDARYTIASTPAVTGDRVLVGDASGTLNCLSLKNGSMIWKFNSNKSIHSSPEVADGKVVFGSCDSNIYCLNLSNGNLVWKVATGAALVSSPVIKDGNVYIGGSDNNFRSIDLNSGKINWIFDGLKGFVETKPFIYYQNIFFGAWDNYLYNLNPADGSVLWKWSNGKENILYSPAACLPIASNNNVFIVAPDRYLTAIGIDSGKTVWRTNRFQVRESIGISENRDMIFAKTMNDTVIAVSSSSSDFKLIWAANLNYRYDINPSMPVEKSGTLFITGQNGTIYALDSGSGKIKWHYKVDYSLVNTPIPIDSKSAILSTLDGKVILIEKGE